MIGKACLAKTKRVGNCSNIKKFLLYVIYTLVQ
jgi:hypothetical protein